MAEPGGRVAEFPAAVQAVGHRVLQLPWGQQLKLLSAVEREGVDSIWIRFATGGWCRETFRY